MLFMTMMRTCVVGPARTHDTWLDGYIRFITDPYNLGLSFMVAYCVSVVLDLTLEWLASHVFRRSVKGYKGFNGDMTCLDFSYKPGEEYRLGPHEDLEICRCGFHFCRKLSDVMNHYPPGGKAYCEVEALGKVEEFSDKCCTDHIRIVRSLSVKEIREILEREHPGNYWLMYFAQLPTKWTDGKPQTETLRQHRKRTMKHRKGYRR